MSKDGKIVQVPPHSKLTDPLGDNLPFYDDEKPLPPPLPLKGGQTTAKLVGSNASTHVRTGEYALPTQSTKKIRDAHIEGERPAPSGQFTPQRAGNALKGYYNRPNWVWALGGVFGLGVLWLATRNRGERKSGIEIEREEIRQAAYEKLRREKAQREREQALAVKTDYTPSIVLTSSTPTTDLSSTSGLEALVRELKETSERDAAILGSNAIVRLDKDDVAAEIRRLNK